MEEFFKTAQSEYLSLRDVVFHTLRHAILVGDLKPGDHLMEIRLAKRLGVSRTPIREAIRMLELEGLVTMIPRKGAQVARITKKDLEDVLEVRCALEKLAVELACQRITAAQLAVLDRTLNEFREAVAKEDLTLMAEKDVAFHDIIFSATQNQRLIQLINHLREQMYRYRLEHLKDKKSHMRLVREHEAILAALKKRDAEAASRCLVEHIYNQADTVGSYIDGEII